MLAEELGVKNLILYHTEDDHMEKRKKLYTKEAEEYFGGRIYVPEDLEVIPLNRN
jgi:ribonuclease Z